MDMGSPSSGIISKEVVVIVVVWVTTLHNRVRIGIQEGNPVSGGIDILLRKGFSRMFGFMEFLELLRMELGNDKGTVLEEKVAAVHPCGKSHGRIPLSEVLHEFPPPCR